MRKFSICPFQVILLREYFNLLEKVKNESSITRKALDWQFIGFDYFIQ